jgi:hypothetical protein
MVLLYPLRRTLASSTVKRLSLAREKKCPPSLLKLSECASLETNLFRAPLSGWRRVARSIWGKVNAEESTAT